MKEISKSVNHVIESRLCDLDNDGDLDILCASRNDSKISWYENLGAGNFGTQNVITTDVKSVRSVIAGDLDNDGDLDVVSASHTDGKVAWYENFGGGVFGNQNVLSNTSAGATSVELADFDNDGFLDIVSAIRIDADIKLFWNNGNNTFTEIVIDFSVPGVVSAFPVYVNADSLVDIVSMNSGINDIAWYQNLGNGSFGGEQMINNSVLSPVGKYAADIDGDGDMDFLSWSNNSISAVWHDNLGGGQFSYHSISSPSQGRPPFPADIDGDGDLDVIIVSYGSDEVWWSKNDAGSFTSSSSNTISSNIDEPEAAVAGDIDGDGDVDILVSGGNDELYWFENDGTGTSFTPHNVATVTDSPNSMDFGDINNDGLIDVAVSSKHDKEFNWFENLGNGNYSDEKLIGSTTNNPEVLHLVDVDSDGDLDAITSTGFSDRIEWFENMGTGLFSTANIIYNSSWIEPMSLHIEDLDNDGDIDLLCQVDNTGLCYFENNGAGVYGSPVIINPNPGWLHTIHSADLNNDSIPDLIYGDYANDEVYWQENLGGLTFGSVQLISNVVDGPKDFNTCDLDGDGDLDILTIGDIDGKIRWFENQGGAVFGPENVLATITGPGRVVTCHDLDMDGDLEVFAGMHGNGDTIIWLDNLGGGVFSSPNVFSDKSSGVTDIEFTDIDTDGDQDVLVSSGNNRVAWYENFFRTKTSLKGTKFYDGNENGVLDSNEMGLNIFTVYANPNINADYESSTGEYLFSLSPGSYQINYSPDTLWHLTTDSTSYNRTISNNTPVHDGLDFGFYPDTLINRLETDLAGGFPRCNDTVNYWTFIQNIGTIMPSGVVELILDDSLSYVNSVSAPDSIIGQSYYWSFDSLFFSAALSNAVSVKFPDFQSAGTDLNSYLNIYLADSSGNLSLYSSDSLIQKVVCAYDPNDKKVTPKGLGNMGFIGQNQILEYMVRFQNTGSDTATSVMIRDQLSPKLDWSSLQILSSSHNMNSWIEQDGELVFHFPNIMLPDSNVYFSGSQGFVKFSIDPLTSLSPGEQIFNNAEIYFDYNPPVITNYTQNTIYDCNNVQASVNSSLLCYGESFSGTTLYEGFNTYSWSLDTSTLSSSYNIQWVTDTTGTIPIQLVVQNEICTKDTTLEIFVPAVIPLSNVSESICLGDSIYLQSSYQTSAGLFLDTLSSVYGCDSIIETALIIDSLPYVFISSFQDDTVCGYDLIPLPNVFPNGGFFSGPGVQLNSFDAQLAGIGDHYVIYTYQDTNGCINADSTEITVFSCLDLDELNSSKVYIYPNPSSNLIKIKGIEENEESVTVKIYSINGELVLHKKGELSINLNNIAPGTYYVEIRSGGGLKLFTRFVRE